MKTHSVEFVGVFTYGSKTPAAIQTEINTAISTRQKAVTKGKPIDIKLFGDNTRVRVFIVYERGN